MGRCFRGTKHFFSVFGGKGTNFGYGPFGEHIIDEGMVERNFGFILFIYTRVLLVNSISVLTARVIYHGSYLPNDL